MSNPWAKSFEDLRAPYLQEKKAKKDYDGDGKVESGAKEYRGVVHNKIQKAKGGKADGQDTSSVKESKAMKSFLDKKAKKLEGDKKKQSAPYKNNPAFGDPSHHSNKKNRMEHHQKDADGKVIEHEDDTTPSSVEEAKIDKIDPKNKRKRRNERQFGKQTKPYDPPTKEMKTSMGKFMNSMRHDMHDKKRGVKTKVAEEMTELERQKNTIKTGMMNGKKLTDKQIQGMKAGLTQGGNKIDESDKKGSGSGKKDACYKKVKASASVWPSAYASGRLVQCRKKGAANYGNSKKEEFDFRIKSFDDMVGECWKTHKKQGMKMKGGKMVPNCVPKNEEAQIDEMDGSKLGAGLALGVAGGGVALMKKAADAAKGLKQKMNKRYNTQEEVFIEALKGKKLDIDDSGKVKNKIEINPEVKSEEAKAPVKK